MSKVSFKRFVDFVDLEGDVSDEQINEIFGLFKNNDKVEKLKKERERLKGMSDKKKAELDQALADFKAGKKSPAKGVISNDVWDDVLGGDDRGALARHDKAVARQSEKDKADNQAKNKTGRNFYEAATKTYYVHLDTKTGKLTGPRATKLGTEKHGYATLAMAIKTCPNDAQVEERHIDGSDDWAGRIMGYRDENGSWHNVVKVKESKEPTIKAIKLKIDPSMTDADIWNFIENQHEVTIEDFEKKGDVLYLYPHFEIEMSEPKLKGLQQRLQRMI